MSDRFVVISGCSGGGKSTLLAELSRRGHDVVDEPGRRIVREERAGGGAALPWIDMAAFARRAVAMAIADLKVSADRSGWTFFDRGLIDAAVAFDHVNGTATVGSLGHRHRYHNIVFLTPPWRSIYGADDARRHSWDAAVEEYERLAVAYSALGYDVRLVPKIGVAARADWLLAALAEPPACGKAGVSVP